MNSTYFNHEAVTLNAGHSLPQVVYNFLSDYVDGNIDADEFSHLLDMHIVLSTEY